MIADVHVELAARAVADSPPYRCAWKAFCAWCREQDRAALPAAPETLLAYIDHRYRVERRAAATLHVVAYGIVKAHEGAGLPSPSSEKLRALLSEARRRVPRPSAAGLDEVRAVVGTCGEDVSGLRDRALLLCVHHGRLSRVKVVGLDIEHLGQPELAALRRPHAERGLCPALAIERWLDVRRQPQQGPLFVSIRGGHFGDRLYPGDVYRILRQRCEAARIRRLTALALRVPGARWSTP